MSAQENPCNIKNGVILAKQMQVPRFCAYCYVLAYGQEHSTGVYTCTALIIREIYLHAIYHHMRNLM